MSAVGDNRIEGARQRNIMACRNYWKAFIRRLDTWVGWDRDYYRRLGQIYQFLVASRQCVIEVGCA